MKKIKKLLLLLCLMAMGTVKLAAMEAYACFTIDSNGFGTLTFYYDNNQAYRTGTIYSAASSLSSTTAGWLENKNKIDFVVFDSSFAGASPLGTKYWFYGCKNLRNITGIANLHTDMVYEMDAMFYGCSMLTSLDLSGFNTARVTSMSGMFSGCTDLSSLNISHFNTADVKNMSGMFRDCSKLSSLSVSSFNTAKVTDMSGMFSGCSKLTSLDVSNFNTANVTNMSGMFSGCSSLSSLDVSNFNTASVTNMSSMFNGCSSLTTIYCNVGWSASSSSNMFAGCTSLVNQVSGFSYDSGKTNATYANPDTGYFTAAPYVVYTPTNNTLTFYRDGLMTTREGTVYLLPENGNNPGWKTDGTNSNIHSVVFDSSFANALPVNTRNWFDGCSNLVSITGIGNLNTAHVTDMSEMFDGCSSLSSLDVSNFNTANVTSMNHMFYGCSSLDDLEVSSFNTANVTDMRCMFYGCSALTSLDVSNFNTANVTNMSYMFYDCSNLTYLDLSSFNTKKVTGMGNMFKGCSGLTTIIAGDNWSTTAVTSSTDMFAGCTNLVGRNGTRYDAGHVDKEYACIDNAPTTPGYLSDIANPTPTVSLQLAVLGEGTLSLLNSEGSVVGSATGETTSTVIWTKGDALRLVATGPTGANLTNAKAHIIVDGNTIQMTKITDESNNTRFEYEMSNVVKAHAFTLVLTGYQIETPDIIEFADVNVKAICVANWDTDHDGELSKEEAAAVTTLMVDGTSVFQSNTTITSFDELQYFTGLTSIEESAFCNCNNLMSVVLPAVLTSIDTEAFKGCGRLNEIKLPESLTTIGGMAFYGSGLRMIYIPERVSTIGNYAFAFCQKLVSILVDEKNQTYDSREGCNGIIRKVRENTYSLQTGTRYTRISEGVTIIGMGCYCDSLMESVVLPSTITMVSNFAFTDCKQLKSVVAEGETPPGLGNNDPFGEISAECVLTVPYGKRQAYIDAGWTTDIFKGGVVEETPVQTPDIIEFADTVVKRICVENWDTDHDGELSKEEAAAVTTLMVGENSVFRYNTAITSFDELEYFTGLTELATGSFQSCTSLKSVHLPSTITKLGQVCFDGCSLLTKIDLPESLTTLVGWVFGHTGLKMIYIPKNVSTIGACSFGHCPDLTSIVVDKDNTVFDSKDGCNGIFTKDGKQLIVGTRYTKIPEGIEILANTCYAFDEKIETVEIPSTVRLLVSQTFYGCKNLKNIISKASTAPSFNSTYSFYNISSNCVLTVPYGTKQAYINAGWTTDIFKGGIVEAPSDFDVNRDGLINVSDVTSLVNKILHP